MYMYLFVVCYFNINIDIVYLKKFTGISNWTRTSMKEMWYEQVQVSYLEKHSMDPAKWSETASHRARQHNNYGLSLILHHDDTLKSTVVII